MDDAVGRVPFVVSVVFALDDQRVSSGIVDVGFPDQIVEHDLRTGELAIQLDEQVLVAGKLDRRPVPGGNAAEQCLPVFGRLRREDDPLDRVRLGIAEDVPFAVLFLRPIDDPDVSRGNRGFSRGRGGVLQPAVRIGLCRAPFQCGFGSGYGLARERHGVPGDASGHFRNINSDQRHPVSSPNPGASV